jgi:CheY-like chemotaxis protein
MPTILVVDDEPNIRQFLRSALEGAGYEVSEAANGKEAMAQIRRMTFDLAIIDLVMPEQDGLETLRILKREFPVLRTIVISGFFAGSELDRHFRMAELLGARACLAKPLSVQIVLETVRMILDAP